MEKITFRPIGRVYTPFKRPEGMPIQPAGAIGVEGRIEVEPEFEEGLKDLDGFSHIVLLYHFHKSEGYKLIVKPYMDETLRGVFATRAPKRPNSIGFSIVKLIKVEKNIVYIENVDMLNGTPLLDIKPFVPKFDLFDVKKTGWLESTDDEVRRKKSDSSLL